MSQRSVNQRSGLLGSAGLLAGLLAVACASDGEEPNPGAGATGGSAGSAASGSNAGAPSTCAGTHVVTPKRVVRLSEHQLFNAFTSLFGAEAAAVITANEDPPTLAEREFPPISGDIGVSELLFGRSDRLAQAAMKYVSENADALTACGAEPSDAACVQDYLLSFAEKAFRHPLSSEERSAITEQLWTELGAADATPAEALGYGVYAILSSPSFLYRTEFGTDPAADGPLTPYELATAISLFLTDRPPDADLLAAAASNQLGTPSAVRAQATRILATPEARENLEYALIRYFNLTNAPTVILNPEATPGLSVTGGLQASIFREGELFLKNLLWSEPLGALLTSRKTWTSAEVATEVYQVAAPTELDTDGFGLVELPPDRSGLLTLSTFLLSGARSTGGSPVTRGLAVNGSIVCEVNPLFPEVVNPETGQLEQDPKILAAIESLANMSELEKAQYRATTPTCSGCHLQFDAFGMVLEPYDAIGRYRTEDLDGRSIDASWTTTTLPESVGGARVTSAAETAQALVASGALDRCMAMNFINFALTEVSRGGANNTDLGSAPQTGSCAVQGVIDNFAATDGSFASLMREIAASDTLALRSKGQ
jgi:hypothetical protein